MFQVNLLWLSTTAILVTATLSQEDQANFSSHNVGYKHVYPPADISVDQQSCTPDTANNLTCPLFVALLMSFGGAYTSSGVVPAIQVALDQINSEPSMLPGYTLHYTLKDSQVVGYLATGAGKWSISLKGCLFSNYLS